MSTPPTAGEQGSPPDWAVKALREILLFQRDNGFILDHEGATIIAKHAPPPARLSGEAKEVVEKLRGLEARVYAHRFGEDDEQMDEQGFCDLQGAITDAIRLLSPPQKTDAGENAERGTKR